jgi:tRNA threonylcarbamoyladenosine biosynthesis protein TsaB
VKLLAIDSSGLVASVAIVTETDLIAEYTINYKKTHSQTLLPMLDEIVKMTEGNLSDIDGIAISAGPGSFTGLRIGSSTAKGLGLVLEVPLIPIPTVDGLAFNLYNTNKLICPLMDARRNEVYTGLYRFMNNEFQVLTPQKPVKIDEIIHEINQIGEEVIFLGDGVKVYEERIHELIKVDYSFAPPHLSKQRAGAIGALGIQYLKEGIKTSADSFAPTYLRLSQAERELALKADREGKIV